MANTSAFFEKIQDYLDGLLSKKERAGFEQQLKIDQELADEVALYKSVQTRLSDKKIQTFREKLKQVKAEQEQPPKVRSLRFILTIAAGVTLLLVAAFWLLRPTAPTAQELLSAHLKNLDPNSIVPPFSNRNPGDSTASEGQFDQARNLFKNGQYVIALDTMQLVPAEQRNNAYYYELGVLFLLNQQATSAITALQQMDNSQEGGQYWYLALSYLTLGQEEASKEELQKILNDPTSTWQPEARKLLGTLE